MNKEKSHAALKKIIASAIFVAVGVGLLFLFSALFQPADGEQAVLKEVKPYGLLAEPDDTIDVIIYGDSEAFSAFSPVQMWEEYGFTSYVCSSASQYISLTDSFVHQTLEKQHPKVVFLETNAIYRKMDSDDTVISMAQKVFPIFKYHNIWKDTDPFGLGENEADYCWQDDLKGFKYIDIINRSTNPDYMKKTKAVKSIPGSNVEYVKSICDYCRQNGVQVVFVSAPSTINWNYAKHNATAALAKQLNVPYIDLNLEDLGLDWNHDTCDRGDHVNYYGATKVTAFFGKYVKENFGLTDRRNDAAYADWNKLREKYEIVISRSKIQ